jgi:ABC-type sugar transport system substrate-binding protein
MNRLGVSLSILGFVVSAAACRSGHGTANQEKAVPRASSGGELTADRFPKIEGKTIGFVPIGLGTPLTEEWLYRLQRGAERNHWAIATRDPNWDAQAQPAAVQTLIDQRVDALVVHNTDINLNAEALRRAEEAGIWTITVNMASSQLPSLHVGAEWGYGGGLQAQALVDVCGGQGKVALITGDASSQATLDLLKGGQKVFDANPKISIVATQAANWDRTRAHDIAATLLTQHADLCGFWVFWDQMAYGSALAVREAGRQGKVHVVTMDSTIGCQGVGEGLIDVTFSFHVPEQGDQVVDALAMFFQMGEQGVKPGQFRTAVWSEWTKITRDNVGQPGLCYTGKT